MCFRKQLSHCCTCTIVSYENLNTIINNYWQWTSETDSLVLILILLSLLSMVTGFTYGSNNSLTVLWKIWTIYSRILLTQLTQDWADTELSNILDYQMVTILTWVLTHNFFVTAPILGLYNCKSIPFGYLLQLLVQGYEGLLLCFCSLHSWSNWWSRRQGVRKYNMWRTETLGELFEHVTEVCLLHDEVFSGKRQNFWSWEYSPQVLD